MRYGIFTLCCQMIGSTAPACCFAVLYRHNQSAALGFAVAEKDYVGLYETLGFSEVYQYGYRVKP